MKADSPEPVRAPSSEVEIIGTVENDTPTTLENGNADDSDKATSIEQLKDFLESPKESSKEDEINDKKVTSAEVLKDFLESPATQDDEVKASLSSDEDEIEVIGGVTDDSSVQQNGNAIEAD